MDPVSEMNDDDDDDTNPPINSQNNRVWLQVKKSDVVASSLLAQHAKFASQTGVSFKRRGGYTSAYLRTRLRYYSVLHYADLVCML